MLNLSEDCLRSVEREDAGYNLRRVASKDFVEGCVLLKYDVRRLEDWGKR